MADPSAAEGSGRSQVSADIVTQRACHCSIVTLGDRRVTRTFVTKHRPVTKKPATTTNWGPSPPRHGEHRCSNQSELVESFWEDIVMLEDVVTL